MFFREIILFYCEKHIVGRNTVGVTKYLVDTAERLYDIHNYARQYLEVANGMMKARCGSLANSAGYQEGD
jgi:hypothetical protein